jgi:NitT/TauT family transport system substrate-binding protein
MLRARLLLILGALALAVTTCGGDGEDPPGGEPAASKPARTTKVKLAVLPVADVAPLYLGIEKGFFREQNLEIETRFAQGGAAIVPSVLSNEVQFGFGNNVSLMIARARKLPLRIVTEGVQGAGSRKEAANALLVAKDSDIESIEDLAGRTFAVSTLQNLGEVTIRRTLDKHGVDTKGIEFLEIAFPEMNAAVASGRADVAWQAEPFITMGEQSGMRSLTDPMLETAPNLSIATYFGADPYLDANPEVAAAFARAMEKSLAYAAAHPDEARAIIPTYSSLKGPVLERVQLANWSPELNVASIRTTYELAREQGVIDKDLDVDEILPRR